MDTSETEKDTSTTEEEKSIFQAFPPEILDKIVGYLDHESLSKLAGASKASRNIAADVIYRTQIMEWLLLDFSEDEDTNTIHNKIQKFTEKIWNSQPRCMIFFYTDRFDLFSVQQFINNHSIARTVRSRSAVCAVLARGVVGTAQHTNMISELTGKHACALLSLPHCHGVDIYTFAIPYEAYGYAGFDVNQYINVPKDTEVKAIILFCCSIYTDPHIFDSLLQHFKGCVIAGGFAKHLILPTNDYRMHQCMCIAICGPRVHATSVVINDDANDEAVQNSIMQLSEHNLPEKISFAFMFRSKENGRARVFKANFPDTPLFGFLGSTITNKKVVLTETTADTTVICRISVDKKD